MNKGITAAFSALGLAAAAMAQQATPGSEWLTYNNGLDGQRFSPLKQIAAGNVQRLAQACRV